MPAAEPADQAGAQGWAPPDAGWAPGRAPQPHRPEPYAAPAPPAGPTARDDVLPLATSYVDLGRTPSYRWWKELLATLLAVPAWGIAVAVLLGLVAAGTVLAGGEVGDDGFPADQTLSGLAGLLTIAAALPVIVLAARLARGRWGTVSSVAGRVRWRWLLLCTAVAVPAVVLVLIGTVVGETVAAGPQAPPEEDLPWVGRARFLTAMAGLVLLVPLQAAAEEYVFRGWLVQVFSGWLRTPWPGIALSAVLFALAHGLFEVSGFVSLVWFALVMTWLTLRTGGLEAAVAFHAVNNLAAFTVAAAFGGLEAEPETAASASWASAVLGGLLLLPYVAAVLALHRRRERRAAAAAGAPA